MSDTELEILPVREPDDYKKDRKKYHPNLPKITDHNGSIILLVAPVKSGKSTIISNLLLSKHFWGGKQSAFDGGVHIFSPTIHLDTTSRFLRDAYDVYTEYDDEILENILDTQKSYEKKNMPKIMMVFDDMSGMLGSRNSNINHFLTRHRHYNCNCMLSIQNFRNLSNVARSNSSYVLLLNGIVNDKEFEKLQDEYDGIYKGTLKYMYKKYTKKPYSFLYLDLRSNPARMFQNFTKELNWKKEIKNAKQMKNYDEMDMDEGEEY